MTRGVLVAGVIAFGCAHATTPPPSTREASARSDEGTRTWLVVDARCSDGPIDLERAGVSMRLTAPDDLARAPSFVVEENRDVDGCAVTAIWGNEARADGEQQWIERVRVAFPPGSACDVFPEGARDGRFDEDGRGLAWVVRRSRLCGGLVATLWLRPAEQAPIEVASLLRRWIAYVVTGDLAAAIALFDDVAVLVPPPTSPDELPRRIEGREAIAEWHRRSFAGGAWRAMRLVAFEGDSPRAAFEWEYVDATVEAHGPVRGHAEIIAANGRILELRFLDVPSHPELPP